MTSPVAEAGTKRFSPIPGRGSGLTAPSALVVALLGEIVLGLPAEREMPWLRPWWKVAPEHGFEP